MQIALWPDAPAEQLEFEFERLLVDSDVVVFVAERGEERLCGMIEAGVRPFANGVDEEPCAFVEGWWVDPDVRRTGLGRDLIEAVEHWALDRGFHELGSDALLDNALGQRAHLALGFEERERTIAYRKLLTEPPSSSR